MEKLLKKYGFKQDVIGKDLMDQNPARTETPTSFPEPIQRFRLVYEDYSASIEETYFWFLNHLRTGLNFPTVHKVTDVFSASEHSSLWGASQTKVSLQQQNASQYMRGVSEMLKALFQLVREIRDLDMRLKYYKDSYEKVEDWQTAEITLKGLWVDLVEGGSKSPASVYGMAQQLGFTILPDLFFRTVVEEVKDIGPVVDQLEFNPKVKEVLKRKLRQYYDWKDVSYKELTTRRAWTLKYLRQHYNTIRLYTQWIKPYLKYAKRLQMQDMTKSPDIIASFETSMTEIEILAVLPQGKANTVINLHFLHKTKPSMDYNREGYQHRGPLHVGEVSITMRGYSWTNEQIEAFLKMREEEDMALIADYDQSVNDAMTHLGDDMKKYLEEAGEKFPEKEKLKTKKKKSLSDTIPALEPFIALGGGFKEMFGALGSGVPKGSKNKEKKKTRIQEWHEKKDADKAAGTMLGLLWVMYKNYKKAHGMVTW